MAFVLAPATPIATDAAQRLVYVETHLLAWRLGWAVWIAAALSLLAFYAWWRGRIGASLIPVALAASGLVADVTSETMLILYDATTAPFAFVLTGVVANGLYTTCGIWLTLAMRLTRVERIWAALMWGAGITLSLATLASLYLLAAVATALLFALFCPWCVYLAVKLR
ncbi:MAG TPA: hypothetical protein VFQ66_04725 [Candidatus Limnocylindria bacterium]|nr:hypothetical protein [Candidatus Limnocylindria bacterium]